MMRQLVASALIIGAATASAAEVTCKFPAHFELTPSGLEIVKQIDADLRVRISEAQIFVDDRLQTVSAADRQRLRDLDRDARALLVDVAKLAQSAIDLATEAIQVSAVELLGSERATALRPQFDALRSDLRAAVSAALERSPVDEQQIEQRIRELVAQWLPQLVAAVTAAAVQAALSGGPTKAEELTAGAERLALKVETALGEAAEAVEEQAKRLCLRASKLSQSVRELEFRLPDGRPIELDAPTIGQSDG